jgi:multimeric flavodoxin WrbA
MNIVCLLGSPRPAGNSATIAKQFTETAAELGATIRTFELNRLTYRGCQGCYACKTQLDRCILRDDLTEVLDAAQDADVLVLATPIYYGEVTGQLKCFIDRTFSYLVPDFITSSNPSRLTRGKRLVFVATQGQPDESLFADIFPRYERFFKWLGFTKTRLIRACGLGPDAPADVMTPYLRQAEEAAREICG